MIYIGAVTRIACAPVGPRPAHDAVVLASRVVYGTIVDRRAALAIGVDRVASVAAAVGSCWSSIRACLITPTVTSHTIVDCTAAFAVIVQRVATVTTAARCARP